MPTAFDVMKPALQITKKLTLPSLRPLAMARTTLPLGTRISWILGLHAQCSSVELLARSEPTQASGRQCKI